MKFNTITAVAWFGITAHAYTLPSFMSKRATTPVSVVQADLNTLQTNVGVSLGAITSAVGGVGGSVTGQLRVIAALNVDLAAIANNVTQATGAITTATQGAVTALNPIDVQTLVTDLGTAESLVTKIQVTLHNGLTTLPASIVAAVGTELLALEIALKLLVAPLVGFALAVGTDVGATGVSVTGLQAAVQSLEAVVTDQSSRIGVGK